MCLSYCNKYSNDCATDMVGSEALPVIWGGVPVSAQDDQVRHRGSHCLPHDCVGLAPEASHQRLDDRVQPSWHMPKLRINMRRPLRSY